jgi:hypothetical protein
MTGIEPDSCANTMRMTLGNHEAETSQHGGAAGQALRQHDRRRA